MELTQLVIIFSVMYLILFIMLLLIRFIKQFKSYQTHLKRKFTQEFIFNNEQTTQKLQSIVSKSLIMYRNFKVHNMLDYDKKSYTINDKDNFEFEDFYLIISFINEISQGIKDEIYDSDLLKSKYHTNLILFYQINYDYIDNLRIEMELESSIFNLESLIREWNTKNSIKRRI